MENQPHIGAVKSLEMATSDHDSTDSEPNTSPDMAEGTQSPCPMLVEVICERAHCVIYEYAIITVKFIADEFHGRVKVKPVVRRGSKKNVDRYLELCRINGKHLSVPAILLDGQLAFTYVPGPEELRQAIEKRLTEREVEPVFA